MCGDKINEFTCHQTNCSYYFYLSCIQISRNIWEQKPSFIIICRMEMSIVKMEFYCREICKLSFYCSRHKSGSGGWNFSFKNTNLWLESEESYTGLSPAWMWWCTWRGPPRVQTAVPSWRACRRWRWGRPGRPSWGRHRPCTGTGSSTPPSLGLGHDAKVQVQDFVSKTEV